MTRQTRIKICCIKSKAELQCAIEAGASAIGLVTSMPSGPGIITDEDARLLTSHVPTEVMPFLLTSETTAPQIVAQARDCAVRVFQFVDHILVDTLRTLRTELPDIGFVQVIHVQDESAQAQVQAIEPYVDMILLDSGRPDAGELGGTGRTHNWQISADIVATCSKPVWLAGGLNPDNVEAAIRQVRPYGVDLCSGVRTNDRLDAEKLEKFTASVKRADTSVS